MNRSVHKGLKGCIARLWGAAVPGFGGAVAGFGGCVGRLWGVQWQALGGAVAGLLWAGDQDVRLQGCFVIGSH